MEFILTVPSNKVNKICIFEFDLFACMFEGDLAGDPQSSPSENQPCKKLLFSVKLPWASKPTSRPARA
jgi:hypothetical protein